MSVAAIVRHKRAGRMRDGKLYTTQSADRANALRSDARRNRLLAAGGSPARADGCVVGRFAVDRVFGCDRCVNPGDSHRLAQRWTDELANWRSAASSSAPSVVGGGGFPRSFLIPGTDTSIRIGGA
jgi:hypothetical protein